MNKEAIEPTHNDQSLRIMKIISSSLAIAALVFWFSIIIWCLI